MNNQPVTVLIADDDPDDRLMLKEAFTECFPAYDIRFAEDGESLLEYFYHPDKVRHPSPSFILLDLNMPRKDGREALREIKTDPLCKRIPVIVFTTSKSDDDISTCYELGGNCFITKPSTYADLTYIITQIGTYWGGIVELPLTESV